MSEGTRDHILDPINDSFQSHVAVPFFIFSPILSLYDLIVWLFRKLYGCSVSWNRSHINFGASLCFTLKISIVSFLMFLWWIVKVFFFPAIQQQNQLCLYTSSSRLFLAIYWFDYAKIDCETSNKEGNIQIETRREHSWWALFVLMYLEILARVWSFWFAFLYSIGTCSVKLSLLPIKVF